MDSSRVIRTRVALGVAVTIGLLFAEAKALTPDSASFKTVYAAAATPSLTPGLRTGLFGQGTPTPTLVSQLGQPAASATAVAMVGQPGLLPAQPTPPQPSTNPSAGTVASPSQAASDQIAAVAALVAQVSQDPTMPVETKITQINALATQFNQLVMVWQQLIQAVGVQTLPNSLQSATPQAVTPQSVPPQPLATATPALGQSPSASPTPMPVTNPSTTARADQLRAQIAQVAQQMGAVSQDASLSVEQKTAQLNALAARFNQLTLQLQQEGGG